MFCIRTRNMYIIILKTNIVREKPLAKYTYLCICKSIFQVRFVLFKLLVAQSSDESSTIQDWSKLTALALELLDTLSRLDPGASRNRGKVLKDLIKPFMKLAELELQTQKIDAEAYAKRKNMAKEFAKDLIMCYRYENTQNIR